LWTSVTEQDEEDGRKEGMNENMTRQQQQQATAAAAAYVGAT